MDVFVLYSMLNNLLKQIVSFMSHDNSLVTVPCFSVYFQIHTMHRLVLCLFFATTLLFLSQVTCQPDAMLAPPGRPAEFRTPDQLRRYLKALNDYYAIVGRPR